jgi:crotonobetainyl-CoA:carnitine CoA-transferase CaiB-like acyl-CoA transferase
MDQALKGIKIVELSQLAAGPLCSMMLADMGAEVIKIEIPDRGDGLRHWGMPYVGKDSVYFLGLNRNKKSVTLNLKTQKGKKIFFKMLKTADVLIENFRPGTMERLGLGYEIVMKINPKIIYCRISGYGQTGPYRQYGGYDLIAQGESGLMMVTGEENGPPIKIGAAVVDYGAGMNAAYGVVVALLNREKTSKGQMVDVALLDTAVYWMAFYQIGSYFAMGKPHKRLTTGHPLATPYEAYKTRDIYITIGCSSDKHWKMFCDVIGRKELTENPLFETNLKRVENRAKLSSILSEIFVTKNGKEWLTLFRKVGIPCGPVNTIEKVVSDKQVVHREMLITIDHPMAGKIKIPGIPVKLSETPGTIKQPPPILSQHTEEVLTKMGFSKTDIKKMRQENVI